MIVYVFSFDQGGLLVCIVEDCVLMLGVMVGFDLKDLISVEQLVDDYLVVLQKLLSGLCIGLLWEYFGVGFDSCIVDVVLVVVEELKMFGVMVKDIFLLNMQYVILVYYVIVLVEVFFNLLCFDGVCYGYCCDVLQNLEDLYKCLCVEGFGSEVKNCIMVGIYVFLVGYYDVYYLQVQKICWLIKNDFVSVFVEVDVIFGLIMLNLVWKIGEKNDDLVFQYLEDIYIIIVNFVGLLGLFMFVGFVDGLLVGVQLFVFYFQEGCLFNVVYQYQQVSDWYICILVGF